MTLQMWFNTHKRELPWRKTNDAYKIWLSEIILQQTRVSQGLPYYNKFEHAFPSIDDFAEASEGQVLQLWQGLGYYSRGRNMLKCALQVKNQFDGRFPKTYKEMVSLPGIGDYTASAILSFAYNLPFAVLDGNVFRFLSRLYGISTAINSSEGTKVFKQLANELLDQGNPANHNQAIMEFGALHCTPKKPLCHSCPFQEDCVAVRTNKVDELPHKLKAKPRTKRYFNYLILNTKLGTTYIQQRQNKGIWQGLYEFPLIESKSALTESEILRQSKDLLNGGNNLIYKAFQTKHVLSHQEIYAVFWTVEDSSFRFNGNSNIFEVGFEEIQSTYAVPVLIAKFLNNVKLS